MSFMHPTGRPALGMKKLSATGATDVIDLGTSYATFTFQSVTTGSPASISVTYQGSLDGTNWYTLGTSTATAGDAQHVVDKPSQYIRANLTTLTGGTAPTIQVYVGATA